MRYQVTADIRYIDGSLAGLTIPAGYRTTWGDRQSASRAAAWLRSVMNSHDFVRACGTGNKYEIIGRISIDPETAPIYVRAFDIPVAKAS